MIAPSNLLGLSTIRASLACDRKGIGERTFGCADKASAPFSLLAQLQTLEGKNKIKKIGEGVI